MATICAMVSIGSAVFYRPKDKAVHAEAAHKNFSRGNVGDHIALLNVYAVRVLMRVGWGRRGPCRVCVTQGVSAVDDWRSVIGFYSINIARQRKARQEAHWASEAQLCFRPLPEPCFSPAPALVCALPACPPPLRCLSRRAGLRATSAASGAMRTMCSCAA